jgi:hypothetical protein
MMRWMPGPEGRSVRASLTRLCYLAPLVLPPMWALFVLVCQPPNELNSRRWDWTGLLFFDDHDDTAMVLRGLNANRGRLAGQDEEPDEDLLEWEYGVHQDRALAPRYHLEYPHTALLLFRLAAWVGQLPRDIPNMVLDGNYHNIVRHEPESQADLEMLGGFRRAICFLIVVMTAALVTLVLTLQRGYLPGGKLNSSGILLLLPGAVWFSLFRFDIIPTLLTALSLACLGRQRWLAAGALFGLAALVKVYPLLLGPLMLRYLFVRGTPDGRGLRASLHWLAGGAGVVALFLLPPLLTSGWEAVWSPYRFQLNRDPFMWNIYGYVLPKNLSLNTHEAKLFRLTTLLIVGLGLAAWPVPDLPSLLRRGAVILIVFICLSVVFSPQWIIWLAPMLLPLASRNRLLFVLIIVLDLSTFLLWPFMVYIPDHWFPHGWAALVPPTLNYVRFATFAALVLTLLGVEIWARISDWQKRRVSPALSPALGGAA